MLEAKYVYLKGQPLFNSLDEQKLKEVSSVMKILNVYRSESINYGDGDFSKICFVVKGKVKIAEANDMGDELIKDILTEGDFFGDLSLDGNPSQEEYAEALTANTTICCFNVTDFRKILHSNPGMALKFANQVKIERAHV